MKAHNKQKQRVAVFPEKAVILAAGYGSRMRPLTYDTPKPLMPLWNRALLDRIIDFLIAHGVREILINLHYQAEAIYAHLRRHTRASTQINFSFEPAILGTAGALRHAAWFLDTKPFWLVNADIAMTLDPAPLCLAIRKPRALAALWLTQAAGPRTVEVSDGWVNNFRSEQPGAPNTYTFTGLHLLSPKILDFIPNTGSFSIIKAYEQALSAGSRIAGVCPAQTYWNDLGSPTSYLAAHAETATTKSSFLATATSARVAATAAAQRSVIWSGATLEANAVANDAIIGRNCVVQHSVPRLAVHAQYILPHDAALRIAINHLQWQPQHVTVIPFDARGSARTFTRLAHGSNSVMMIKYQTTRAENALYASHTRLLQDAGVQAPRLLLNLPRQKLLLVEDLGDVSLESKMRAQPVTDARTLQLYQRVLDNVIRLHLHADRLARHRQHKVMPGFTPRLYKWEREFFERQFLRQQPEYKHFKISRILAELRTSATFLRATPNCLIHRDLQSSNIIFRKTIPYFIDFQGMRHGAAAYDLASLLCDPYVELSENIIIKLLNYYNNHSPRSRRISEQAFRHAAVERLAQALGAYARLSIIPETQRFAIFIPAALRRLLWAGQLLKTHRALKDACIILNARYNAGVSM